MCTQAANRQIVLASRPAGMTQECNFTLRETAIPRPQDGERLVRTLYLSVDPYMRGRMNDKPSYIEPFQLNQPITGGGVGRIIESHSPDFKPGDIIQGFLPWADYSVVSAQEKQKLDPLLVPISSSLGVLGMPGLTAYFGFLDVTQPKAGETVVVSGAAGAVGSLVGQIAKLKGCRVVGIAGRQDKVDYLTHELGFDAAFNYKDAGYKEKLKQACEKGVDIYFDNVGGDITDEVLKLINKNARISICGQISMYNLETPDIGPRPFRTLLFKSALAKGFIVWDYKERFPEGIKQLSAWLKEGKIKAREHVVEGLENAPKAFIGLFKGENIGKQIVKVSDQ